MKFAQVIEKLHPTQDMVLVGGNAVIFWAEYYGVHLKTDDLTTDVDFFATQNDVIEVSDRLSLPHRQYIPDMGDPSPNSGKIAVDIEGFSEPVEIDFLRCVTGLSDADIKSRSIEVALGSIKIRVLNPLHCLESKLSNLRAHPQKRSEEGFEQARIAIEVARSYLNDMAINERKFIASVKRVFELARSDTGVFCSQEYGLHAFSSVPPCPASATGKLALFYEKTVSFYQDNLSKEFLRYNKNKERISNFRKLKSN